jgi:hypothetical protein
LTEHRVCRRLIAPSAIFGNLVSFRSLPTGSCLDERTELQEALRQSSGKHVVVGGGSGGAQVYTMSLSDDRAAQLQQPHLPTLIKAVVYGHLFSMHVSLRVCQNRTLHTAKRHYNQTDLPGRSPGATLSRHAFRPPNLFVHWPVTGIGGRGGGRRNDLGSSCMADLASCMILAAGRRRQRKEIARGAFNRPHRA